MHGAVEHHGRGHALQPKRADEGGGLPVTMGHRGTAPLAAPCPAIAPRHLGRGAGLVDEDQPLRDQVRLGVEPGVAPAHNVRALLLAGVCVFFERHRATVEQAPDRALRHHQTMRLVEMLSHFRQSDVWRLLDQGQDLFGVGLDPLRAVIPAPWLRSYIAGPSPLIGPFDRRRSRHPEALRHRPSCHPSFNRRDKPLSKVVGKRFRHPGWPPSPARILNQKSTLLGIP